MSDAVVFNTYYLPPFVIFLSLTIVLFILIRWPIHLFSTYISKRYSAQIQLCIFLMILSAITLLYLG